MLTTGRVVEHFNSGELTRRSATLMRPYGEERLGINPADAADRGIETGDPVRVSNVRGAVTVPANPTPAVQPGVVFLSFHFADPLVNAPTGDALDPDATIPEYRHSAVSAEAADGGDPGDDGENG